MAKLWLPGDSDFALAFREPNLLVPGKKPTGNVSARPDGTLIALWLFQNGSLVDLVNGHKFAFYGTPEFRGDHYYFNGTGLTVPLDLSDFNKVTVQMDMEVVSYSSSYRIFHEFTSDGLATNGGFTAFKEGDGSGVTVGHRGNSSSERNAYKFTLPSIGVRNILTFVHDAGASTTQDVHFFNNKTKDPSASKVLDETSTINFVNSTFHVFNRNQTSHQLSAKLWGLAIYATNTRVRSDVDIYADADDFYARKVIPINDTLFAVGTPAAGGDTNISATTDSLTLTEYAATVNAEININANTDTLTLTEYAASVSIDVNVSANTDTLTLTEQQASISLDVNISANTDALTLSTHQATIEVGADTNISANTATLTLTEFAATVNAETNVQANSTPLTLTEYQANVNLGVQVNANTASLTLSENTAAITYDVNVLANTDTLVITEYTAGVNAATNIQVNTQALTITEYAGVVNLNVSINTNVDALTLTEYAASISAPQVINANVAALTLSEYAATVTSTGATTLTAQDILNIKGAFKEALRSVLYVDNNT